MKRFQHRTHSGILQQCRQGVAARGRESGRDGDQDGGPPGNGRQLWKTTKQISRDMATHFSRQADKMRSIKKVVFVTAQRSRTAERLPVVCGWHGATVFRFGRFGEVSVRASSSSWMQESVVVYVVCRSAFVRAQIGFRFS